MFRKLSYYDRWACQTYLFSAMEEQIEAHHQPFHILVKG
jgi:hypothetical protein